MHTAFRPSRLALVRAGFLAAGLLAASLSPAQGQFERAPDLVVAAITLAPAQPRPGETVSVSATLTNLGDADAGAFNVRFHLSLAPDEVAITFGAPINDFTVAVQRVQRGLKAGASVEVAFNWDVVEVPLIRLRVTVDSPLDAVEETNERNNSRERALFVSEDALDAWWLEAIEAREALALNAARAPVVVAVVDSGMDWTHPEYAERLWTNPGEVPGNGLDDDENGFTDDVHGWDFVDGDNNPGGTPRNLHATAVAGIIGAANDGQGTTGVAPDVRLMDLRVLDSQGFGSFQAVGAAIVYATLQGADVINLSLGAPENASDFCAPLTRAICVQNLAQLLADQARAIDFAVKRGVLVVAAAGNEAGGVGYPARFPGVLAVGATTRQNARAGYSNRGPQLAVAAPGGALSEAQLKDLFLFSASDFEAVVPQLSGLVVAPYPGDGYGWFSGTSAAAPFVSGAAALLLSAVPGLSPQAVRALLEQTATDLGEAGPDPDFGAGLINVRRALQAALGGG